MSNEELLRIMHADPYDVWVAHDEQDEDILLWRVENMLLDGDAHVVYHKDTVFKLSNGVTLCY